MEGHERRCEGMVDLSARPLAPIGVWPEWEEREFRDFRTGLTAIHAEPAPESMAAIALFGAPDLAAPAIAAPEGFFGVRRAGWLAAIAVHAAAAASLLIALPLQKPEAW